MKNKREMKKKKGAELVIVCFAVALLAALTGCGSAAKSAEYESGWEPVSAPQVEETKDDDTLRGKSENSRQSSVESAESSNAQKSESADSNLQKPEPTDTNSQKPEPADINSQKLIGTVKSIGESSIIIYHFM